MTSCLVLSGVRLRDLTELNKHEYQWRIGVNYTYKITPLDAVFALEKYKVAEIRADLTSPECWTSAGIDPANKPPLYTPTGFFYEPALLAINWLYQRDQRAIDVYGATGWLNQNSDSEPLLKYRGSTKPSNFRRHRRDAQRWLEQHPDCVVRFWTGTDWVRQLPVDK